MNRRIALAIVFISFAITACCWGNPFQKKAAAPVSVAVAAKEDPDPLPAKEKPVEPQKEPAPKTEIAPEKKTEPEPPKKTPVDPVASLKLIAQRLEKEGTKPRATNLKDKQKWERGRFDAVDVAFDVVKTGSLVTPFKGQITWKSHYNYSEAAATKEEAEKLPITKKSKAPTESPWIADFVFRDDKWTIKDLWLPMDATGIKINRRPGDAPSMLDDWWFALGGK